MILKKNAQIEFVKGINRTCVYDIPRNDYDFIPNYISDLFKEDFIEEASLNLQDEDLNYWINFLKEKEYIFSIPLVLNANFTPINRLFENPFPIHLATIDLTENKIKEDIFVTLEKLHCRNVALIIKNKETLPSLLLKLTSTYFFESISILSNETLSKKEMDKLLEEFPQVNNFEVLIPKKTPYQFRPTFKISIELFNEALSYNTFYNRRIFINNKGKVSAYIDNGKEQLQKEFDSNNLSFEIWNVSKDKCTICKDCEFRYMCIDNRIPKLNEYNQYFYETECQYNPYQNTWTT